MAGDVSPGRDTRRDTLLGIFHACLAAVNGRRRMREALAGDADPAPVWVLAVGKAAGAMTQGVLDALGGRVTRALVVSRDGHFDGTLLEDPRVRCIPAGHPVPDLRSLAAGAAALDMARAAAPGQRLLLLVSGGASSLLESLPAGVTLDDLRRISDWAQRSGADIGQVNAVRRRLSAVKDGRLAAAFGHCRVQGFFISDVPGDDPALVGSGLLAAANPASEPEDLPDWLADLLSSRGSKLPGPVPEVTPTCVGRLDDALQAAERAAAEAGIAVERPPGRLEGDVLAAAAGACEGLGGGPDAVLRVQGGETTVTLPAVCGRGGRNQHLALAAALLMEGRADLLLLAAGTDGSDGNTGDAGALVDGTTVPRGRDAGLDPSRCLAGADSGSFLEASGDLVHTGPTGTNVGDLLLAFRCEPVHCRDPGISM